MEGGVALFLLVLGIAILTNVDGELIHRPTNGAQAFFSHGS